MTDQFLQVGNTLSGWSFEKKGYSEVFRRVKINGAAERYIDLLSGEAESMKTHQLTQGLGEPEEYLIVLFLRLMTGENLGVDLLDLDSSCFRACNGASGPSSVVDVCMRTSCDCRMVAQLYLKFGILPVPTPDVDDMASCKVWKHIGQLSLATVESDIPRSGGRRIISSCTIRVQPILAIVLAMEASSKRNLRERHDLLHAGSAPKSRQLFVLRNNCSVPRSTRCAMRSSISGICRMVAMERCSEAFKRLDAEIHNASATDTKDGLLRDSYRRILDNPQIHG